MSRSFGPRIVREPVELDVLRTLAEEFSDSARLAREANEDKVARAYTTVVHRIRSDVQAWER